MRIFFQLFLIVSVLCHSNTLLTIKQHPYVNFFSISFPPSNIRSNKSRLYDPSAVSILLCLEEETGKLSVHHQMIMLQCRDETVHCPVQKLLFEEYPILSNRADTLEKKFQRTILFKFQDPSNELEV